MQSDYYIKQWHKLHLLWLNIHAHTLSYQGVSQSPTARAFSRHLHIFNTRGLRRLLRHRLPASNKRFINRTSHE